PASSSSAPNAAAPMGDSAPVAARPSPSATPGAADPSSPSAPSSPSPGPPGPPGSSTAAGSVPTRSASALNPSANHHTGRSPPTASAAGAVANPSLLMSGSPAGGAKCAMPGCAVPLNDTWAERPSQPSSHIAHSTSSTLS